jgi:hypothetical protein
VLVLGEKLVFEKPSNCALSWWSRSPLQHQSLGAYLKIHVNKIYNIYDRHTHLQLPFQSLYEQGV